jgi:hypothetical protein
MIGLSHSAASRNPGRAFAQKGTLSDFHMGSRFPDICWEFVDLRLVRHFAQPCIWTLNHE